MSLAKSLVPMMCHLVRCLFNKEDIVFYAGGFGLK